MESFYSVLWFRNDLDKSSHITWWPLENLTGCQHPGRHRQTQLIEDSVGLQIFYLETSTFPDFCFQPHAYTSPKNNVYIHNSLQLGAPLILQTLQVLTSMHFESVQQPLHHSYRVFFDFGMIYEAMQPLGLAPTSKLFEQCSRTLVTFHEILLG